MTSTISLTNREKTEFSSFWSLYRWSLRRHAGIFVLYSILLTLALPGVLLLLLSALRMSGYEGGFSIQYFVIPFNVAVIPITMLFTLIVSMMMFSYLHKKRQADLFFALPVKRNTMLCAQFFAALTFLLVPVVLVSLIGGLCFPYDTTHMPVEAMASFYKLPLCLALGVIASLCFSMFCAVCSGTFANTIISVLAVSLVYPVAVFLLSWFASCMLPGFYVGSRFSGLLLTALCPYASVYSTFFSAENELLWQVLWWLFFIAALFIGSLLLNRRRKGEAAETSFAFKAPALTIRFIATITSGISLGWVFSQTDYWPRTNFFGFLLGLVIGSFVCHLVLEAIYYRGFKNLKKSLVYYGIALLATIALYIALFTGFFGYTTRIPAADEVASVTLHDDSNFYQMSDTSSDVGIRFTSAQDIQAVISLHRDIIDSETEQMYTYANPPFFSSPYSTTVTYELKNGQTFSRRYFYYSIDPRESDEGAALLASEAWRKQYYSFLYAPDAVNRISYIECSTYVYNPDTDYFDEDGNYSLPYTKESAAELLFALQADIEAMTPQQMTAYHRGYVDYYEFGSPRQEQLLNACVYIRYDKRQDKEAFLSFDIYNYFENTLRVLEKYNWYTPPQQTQAP